MYIAAMIAVSLPHTEVLPNLRTVPIPGPKSLPQSLPTVDSLGPLDGVRDGA
jgi:hypothetical protein